MSRQYNENCLYIPDEIYYGDDLVWSNGIGYARIKNNPEYIVTSEGDVISLMKKEPRTLVPWHTNHGHLYVDLSFNGIRRRRLIHRLVAEAFLPNPNNYPVVRHLDDDPENNYYGNLAWGTFMDNRIDMIRNGHDFKRAVYCYENGVTYPSCREAARRLGVDPATVTMCCQGKTHSCAGMHLCYLIDLDDKLEDPNWLKRMGNYKPIIAISPEGETIQYNSRKEAAEVIGIPECGISSVVNGHLEHTHGWRFREA